jgi:hypothetical protein
MVIPLSSATTLNCFSSLAPFGQGDNGSSPALLVSTMEQPFYSTNALVLTLSRLAESCIFKWFGYISLRNGPSGMGTRVYPTDSNDTIKLFESYGFKCIFRHCNQASFLPNKENVKWARLVFEKVS